MYPNDLTVTYSLLNNILYEISSTVSISRDDDARLSEQASRFNQQASLNLLVQPAASGQHSMRPPEKMSKCFREFQRFSKCRKNMFAIQNLTHTSNIFKQQYSSPSIIVRFQPYILHIIPDRQRQLVEFSSLGQQLINLPSTRSTRSHPVRAFKPGLWICCRALEGVVHLKIIGKNRRGCWMFDVWSISSRCILRTYQHTPNPQPTVYGSEFLSFGGLGMSGVCSRGMLGFP